MDDSFYSLLTLPYSYVYARLGMLANGTLDIRMHRWFNHYSFDEILSKVAKPPFHPELASDIDTTLFKTIEPEPYMKFILPKRTKDPFEGF